MGKIADTIYKELNYMYCDNCRYNSEITDKDEYGGNPHCEDCHRKYNGWAVAKHTAEYIEELCEGGADMRGKEE